MNIKLIADSTCDLSEELVRNHNIRIVPLSISIGDKILKDGVEVKPKDIFEYVGSGKGLCRTSAVNIAEYTEVYEEERPKCDAIIHLVISSDMSACYQNAQLAAGEFDNIHIIDSRNLSTGIGHLVLDVAELEAQGMDAEEIVNIITQRIALLDTSFMIDTLLYLQKGGRCSAVQALASDLFSIKPCIIVSDGKMIVGKKYRGKLDAVLRRYVSDRLSYKENIDTRRIFVTHTMTEENYAIVEMVKSVVVEMLPFDELYETTAGSTISCHCGPNTLGILFFRKA
jgi:DegV family protein with EDD domain